MLASNEQHAFDDDSVVSVTPQVGNHRPFIALLVLFVLLATSFSLLLPLGESADEVSHFALVRFIAEQKRAPLTQAEREAIGKKGDASPIYHGLVALTTQHTDISALPTLPVQSEPLRFIPYDAPRTNEVYHTADELFPFQGIVLAWHLGRLISVPLGVLTLIGIYRTVLLIYPQRPYFALAATAFAAFLPRFLMISGVLNDDNLVIPLVTFALYFLVRVIQGDQRRSTLIFLGVAIGLATIVKYHGLILWLEVAAVLTILAWRNQWTWRHTLTQLTWPIIGFVAAAGWWFVILYTQFNQVAELGLIKGILAPLGDPVMVRSVDTILDENRIYWIEWAVPLFQSFWIVYGGTQLFAPPIIYQALTILSMVIGGGLIIWLYRNFKTNQWVIRWDMALLLFHGLVYLGIIIFRFQSEPTAVGAQGRHLLPALVSIAFFVVLGLSELYLRSGQTSPVARGDYARSHPGS
ncbi:MAG: glycosyltransferase family 39 protein [Chloroflexota bacterium]